MGVRITRQIEVKVYCHFCSGELIVACKMDHKDVVNVYVEPCPNCLSVDGGCVNNG